MRDEEPDALVNARDVLQNVDSDHLPLACAQQPVHEPQTRPETRVDSAICPRPRARQVEVRTGVDGSLLATPHPFVTIV